MQQKGRVLLATVSRCSGQADSVPVEEAAISVAVPSRDSYGSRSAECLVCTKKLAGSNCDPMKLSSSLFDL